MPDFTASERVATSGMREVWTDARLDARLDERTLGILIEATAQVVGEVSKVYQAMRRAIDGGGDVDLLAAARAFDGLPAWQRARILEVARGKALVAIGRAEGELP